jgi:hypothetical protein
MPRWVIGIYNVFWTCPLTARDKEDQQGRQATEWTPVAR